MESQKNERTKEMSNIDFVNIKAELLFELKSKQDWINRVPRILPEKTRGKFETWLWVNINGEVFEHGLDFEVAEHNNTYPCKVYRAINVAHGISRIEEIGKVA